MSDKSFSFPGQEYEFDNPKGAKGKGRIEGMSELQNLRTIISTLPDGGIPQIVIHSLLIWCETEIVRLRAERDELGLRAASGDGREEELRKDVERLRAALERTRPHVRNEIIEECAERIKQLRDILSDPHVQHYLDQAAAAIRALK